MGLRDALCSLAVRDPRAWADALRRHGLVVDARDPRCRHNLTGTWERCPFFRDAGAGAP